MEFNIRKGATLPYLEVEYIKDGSTDFNYSNLNLDGSIIKLYMKNVETDIYKIAGSNAIFDSENKKIYYQFSKKNTSSNGRYEVELKIDNSQGLQTIPLKEKLFVNVLDSISIPDLCCGPNQNINPEPIPPSPAAPGIYYGKVNSETITSGDISSLTFLNTNEGGDLYVTQPSGLGYGYILVPTTISQPVGFRDSTGGCFGFNVPVNNIGTINLVDANGFLVTYNIYRTFNSFNGEVNIWLCS